jgi:hypothetical protein
MQVLKILRPVAGGGARANAKDLDSSRCRADVFAGGIPSIERWWGVQQQRQQQEDLYHFPSSSNL